MKGLTHQQGLTLIELLVAITILAAVAVPFLGIFLSTARNNADSKLTQVAASLAEQAMSEVKSGSLADLAGKPAAVFYEDEKLTASYLVQAVPAGGTVPTDDFGGALSYGLDVGVSSTQVRLTDRNGNDMLFGLSDFYTIDISGATSPYLYVFSKGSAKQMLLSGTVAESGQNVNLHLTVDPARAATDPKLTMHLMINPAFPADRNVNVYITGPADGCVLYNDGGRDFYQYTNVSQGTAVKPGTLYKISVEVRSRKDNRLMNRLVSYERK